MALGSTQYLREMSTRNFPGGKKRPARRADNIAAIYEPNVWKCVSLNLSQPQGSPRPVTGKILPYLNSSLYVLPDIKILLKLYDCRSFEFCHYATKPQ
jgi:hypothetical protein